MAKKKREPLITDEDLKPENVLIRVSMMIPEDLLNSYREQAAKKGIGYQALMQLRLREGIVMPDLEARIQRIEKKLNIS